MHIPFSVTFQTPSGRSARVCITWCRHRVVLSLGFKIEANKFDGRRCLHGTFHYDVSATVINNRLRAFEDDVNTLFYNAEHEERTPTPHDIKTFFRVEPAGAAATASARFMEFVRDSSVRKQWAFNTVRSVMQVGKLMEAFDSKAKVSDITLNWLNDFALYQHQHKVSPKVFAAKKNGYANNVIAKNCRIFRWFLNWLAERDEFDASIAKQWAPKLKSVPRPVVFLSWEELMDVYNLELDEGTPKAEARDIFCFSCFTSLRYSDVAALTKAQVRRGYIEIVAQKTDTPLRIQLNKYAGAILDRYKHLEGAAALPRMALHRLNYLIKKLAKKAEIDYPVTVVQYYGSERVRRTVPKWELLSSHAGRRTFICNALALGISPTVVMKWTGHTEYSSMKPYIDVTDRQKEEAMRLFDER